jgi:hypothetical protein
MEAICSSETSVATQQTTRRHIPEEDTLLNVQGYYKWFGLQRIFETVTDTNMKQLENSMENH